MSNETNSFEAKLTRIANLASSARVAGLSHSLAYAYIACLSGAELCEALCGTITSNYELHRRLRSRLIKIERERLAEPLADSLAQRLISLQAAAGPTERRRIDATLSHVYECLSPPMRLQLLERWQARGTRDANARWLKAFSEDNFFFSINELIKLSRGTRSEDAAKILVLRAEPPTLRELLLELIEHCETGWIIGRAASRADVIDEPSWSRMREKVPATYAYVCAKRGRQIDEQEALQLVEASCSKWPENDAGLTLWALGQLGMWRTLEKVEAMLPVLEGRLFATIGITTEEASPVKLTI
jgi:hypothetical protein